MLVIPDNYEATDVREMMEILCRQFNFRSVLIHKESVCAALGAGHTSCIVIDIGFTYVLSKQSTCANFAKQMS